jgi:hypothetical protein
VIIGGTIVPTFQEEDDHLIAEEQNPPTYEIDDLFSNYE